MYDPPDVEPDNISEYNSHNYFAIGVFEDKENINILSTTNTADEKFEVISETTHGGQNNESTILGSGLIFETTYLLVRKRHEFHDSKSEKYFFQRFCASTKVTSFPLIYLKGAMFTSIFWSSANEKYSIAG